jgi:hypothetical protein
VECLASACEQIINPVPLAGGVTEAAATEDTACLPVDCFPIAFDDLLLELFLQIVI